MNRVNFDAVLFDLDGVIIDSAQGIYAGIQYTLQALAYALPVNEEALKLALGPPLEVYFKDILKMDTLVAKDAVKIFREYYAQHGIYESVPFDGIADLLKSLKQENVYTAVATSKPQSFAEKILKHHNLYEYFNLVCGTDMVGASASKEALITAALPSGYKNAVMIGDRIFDIQAAQTASIKSLGVRYGYAPPGELELSGADYIVDTAAEIIFILEA